ATSHSSTLSLHDALPSWNVDLRRGGAAPGLLDHPVQHLGHPRGVADLLLVADHVLEQGHLLDFLEAALPDRPVRRLRRDQEHRRDRKSTRLNSSHVKISY